MLLKRILFSIVLGFTLSGYAQTGIYAGLRGCNNQWGDNWIVTPAPELTLTGKYIALSMDGTFGNYSPVNSPANDIFQSRASFVPMLRLPFLKSFFITAGYGAAYIFRREDAISSNGNSEVHNTHSYGGELRLGGGFGISLGKRLSIIIKGGYSRISADNAFYSISTGLLLKSYQSKQQINPQAGAGPGSGIKAESVNPVSMKERLFERAAVIQTTDVIISEFNIYIEALLGEMGITVINWESIRLKLNELNVPSSNAAWIAQIGAEQFNLQVVIETNMRYSYKDTFGGDVTVHHASVRVLKADDSTVLSVLNFDSADADLSVCKKYFRDNADALIYGVSKK